MKKAINQRTFAFTLAEVLITLGIIGVVAAMTIPTLMNNTNNSEFYTAAKKAYSDIANATSKMVADNSGCIWDLSSTDTAQLSLNMKEAYKQYLSQVQEGSIDTIRSIGYYGYKSSTFVIDSTLATNRYALVLKNGMIFRFSSQVNCSYALPNSTYLCGDIILDVNGNNKPNMFGKDVYDILIVKTANGNYKTVPANQDTGFTCSAGSTSYSTSYGCTEYVIEGNPLPQ